MARPVGKAEIQRAPAAKEAVQKEWGQLRSTCVCDEEHPREWDDVRVAARRGEGGTVHVGHLLGMRVEKNLSLLNISEDSRGELCAKEIRSMARTITMRYFKIRVAFPATLQAVKAVDFFGCLPDHAIEIADAEQAFLSGGHER